MWRAHTTNNIKAVQTMEKVGSLAFGRPSAARSRANPTVLGAMHSVCLIADERCAKSTLSAPRNPHLVLPSNTPEAFLNHVDLLHTHRRASRASDAPQSFLPSGLEPIGVLLSRLVVQDANLLF